MPTSGLATAAALDDHGRFLHNQPGKCCVHCTHTCELFHTIQGLWNEMRPLMKRAPEGRLRAEEHVEKFQSLYAPFVRNGNAYSDQRNHCDD